MTDTPEPEVANEAFLVSLAELLTSPSGRRHIEISGSCPDLHTSSVDATTELTLNADLERIPEGIVARGSISGSWSGLCSSGLEPITEPYLFRFDELFERTPVEGQTYPILDTQVDFTQVVRDTVLPELPLAPRCAEAVDGFCDRCADMRTPPQEASIDPRWAALSNVEVPSAPLDEAEDHPNIDTHE